MRALDTNVLARFVLKDDPVQSPLAEAALAQPCFASDTVLLELAWLLSSQYDFDRPDLASVMADLVDLPDLEISDRDSMLWAIERFARGADFADVVHIATSRHADCFATFEKRLDKFAGPNTPLMIERLK